jgi:hypothetical protein
MNTSSAAVAVQKSFLEQSFEKTLGNVTHVPYKPEWKHGDYFNGACAEVLKPGQIVASTVEGRDARRMLLIGTRAGTVVIFERYTPTGGEPFVLVSNACMELRAAVLPSGQIDDQLFGQLVTSYRPEDNIGSRLEAIFNLTAPSKRIS